MIDFVVRGKPKSLGSESKKKWQAKGEFVFIQVAAAHTRLEFS